MFMQVIERDPEVHQVRPLPIQEYLRRECGTEDLFTYWHAKSHNWLVGVWANASKGRFMEMKVLGRAPDPTGREPRIDAQKVREFIRMWKAPEDPLFFLRNARTQEATFDQRRADEDRELLLEKASLARRHRLDLRYPTFAWVSDWARRHGALIKPGRGRILVPGGKYGKI